MKYYLTYLRVDLELDCTTGGLLDDPIPHMEGHASISRRKKKGCECLFNLKKARCIRNLIATQKLEVWGMGTKPRPGSNFKRNLQRIRINSYPKRKI